jgi:hypothetical protein
VLPELLTEPTPDVCSVIIIEPHPVDSDVRWSQRPGGPTHGPLHRSGHAIRERRSSLIAGRARSFCRRSHVVVGIGMRSSHGMRHSAPAWRMRASASTGPQSPAE